MYKPKNFNWQNSEILQIKLSSGRDTKMWTKEQLNIDLNLRIFIHWTAWSTCDESRRIRTRKGMLIYSLV